MSVTVTCPECGAKLKLKSRANLGKKRPCPKCEVPFVLSEEYNEPVYDLDARSAETKRSSRSEPDEPKMLKRGGANRPSSKNRRAPSKGSSGALDFSNRPLAIGLGAGGLISVGMLLAWLVLGGGDNADPAPADPAQETVADSGTTPRNTGGSPTNPQSGTPRRTGEGGQPGGGQPTRTQPVGQTVDMLAGIDVARDKVSGNWDFTAGRLQSSGGDARFQLPFEPHGDYRFEAVVTREAGNEQISIILPLGGGSQVMFVADWIGSGACGLEAVNGQPPGEGNPTRGQYAIKNDQDYRIHAEVHRHAGNVHIQAGIDGGNLVDWKGPVSQLSIFGGWAIPSKNAIGLASGSGRNAGTVVSFREVRLKNLGGESTSSRPPQVASNTTPNQPSTTTPNEPPPPRETEPLPPAIPRETIALNIDFTPDETTYSEVVRPFLQKNCVRCHGPGTQEGSFRVDDGLPNDFVAKVNVDRWSEVLNMLNAGEMPPEGEPRPSLVESTKVIEWIEHERLRAEIARNDRRVVLRRMNRHEYNNTIRDLIGVTFNPGDQFPEDPPAAGFDNNGGALTISPLHLEMYLKAARQILDRAMPLEPTRKPIKWRFAMGPLHNVQGDAVWTHVKDQNGQSIRINAFSSSEVPNRNNMAVLDRPAWNRAAMLHHFHFPGDGEYIIRVRAAHRLPSRQQIIDVGVKHRGEQMRKHFETDRAYDYGPPRIKIRTTITNDVLDEFDVPAPENDPQIYETRAYFPRKRPQSVDGIRVGSVYTIDSVNYNVEAHKDWPYPELMIDWVELEGPFFDDGPRRRLLFDSPNRNNEQQYAREVLQRFMTKAYRRPVTDEEVQRRMALFQKVRPNKPNFEEAIKVPLMAVLSSPHFLYLVEPESFNTEPKANAESDSKAVASGSALNDYQLASRLSYFLWSSMPDDELFQLAEQKRLTDPQVMASQVDRLLADKRSSAFVSNFSGQWLRTREVGNNRPARELFPRYDDHLEVSFIRESEAFFAHILKNDRPVTDFIQSNYVTINERLARFYGIPNVRGDHLRVVQPPRQAHRGGVLTQGSVLSVTSNGTRTSPVWRGVWILENILGDPPPPPPPNAGDIPPASEDLSKATVRQRLRIHRDNPQCARCHNKIDPLGFALENFDTSGEWRTVEPKGQLILAGPDAPAIDASAQLPDGTRFSGIEGLQRELLKRREQFYACLARKMMIYALGRNLGFGDQEAIDQAVVAMKHEPTLRSLIKQIVASDLFKKN